MSETRIPVITDEERAQVEAFADLAIARMNQCAVFGDDAVRFQVPDVSNSGELGDLEVTVQWKRRLQS